MSQSGGGGEGKNKVIVTGLESQSIYGGGRLKNERLTDSWRRGNQIQNVSRCCEVYPFDMKEDAWEIYGFIFKGKY